MDLFAQLFGNFVAFVYHCFDRIVISGYLSGLSRPEKLIDRTRTPLALADVKTIFGFSHRPHQMAKRGRERTEVFKAVQAQSYDLTVFKIDF